MGALPLVLAATVWPCATEAATEDHVAARLQYVQQLRGEVRFTGQFRAIPSALQDELASCFPLHRFSVAEMEYLHWGYEEVELLLIQERESGDVVASAWALWYLEPEAPFLEFLQRYAAKGRKDAIKKVEALAAVLAFSMPGPRREAKWRHGEISVVVNWRDRPWRRLEVGFRGREFGRMRLVNVRASKPRRVASR